MVVEIEHDGDPYTRSCPPGEIPVTRAYWFAWISFYPATQLLESPPPGDNPVVAYLFRVHRSVVAPCSCHEDVTLAVGGQTEVRRFQEGISSVTVGRKNRACFCSDSGVFDLATAMNRTNLPPKMISSPPSTIRSRV